MRNPRTIPLLLVLLVACGASQRSTTIHTVYDAANAASASLNAFSAAHEQAIVDKAAANPTPENVAAAKAEVAAFRTKLAPAEKARDLLFHAIADAAVLNTDQSIGALLQAADDLHKTLAAIGVVP